MFNVEFVVKKASFVNGTQRFLSQVRYQLRAKLMKELARHNSLAINLAYQRYRRM